MNKNHYSVRRSLLYTTTVAKPISHSKVYWKKANTTDIELISVPGSSQKKFHKTPPKYLKAKRRSLIDPNAAKHQEKSIRILQKENRKLYRLKTSLIEFSPKIPSNSTRKLHPSEMPQTQSLKFLRGRKKPQRNTRGSWQSIFFS